MMNGIIGDSTKELSDTAIYTMTNLKSYYDTDSRFYKHFTRQQQILFDNEISGCKFAFMDKDSCDLLGYGWSSYEDKAEVSNRYWIPKKITDYMRIQRKTFASKKLFCWAKSIFLFSGKAKCEYAPPSFTLFFSLIHKSTLSRLVSPSTPCLFIPVFTLT